MSAALALLALLAILAAWWAILEIMCYTLGMHQLKIAGAAALGACLPFVPALVKLMSLPEPVANAVCAAVLAAAYVIVPKGRPEAK